MAWTKKQFVEAALEEIGYAAYIYDLMPEQLQSVLNTLDVMIAAWDSKGIHLGYPLPSTQGASQLGDSTNVPDSANQAIYFNLAVMIAARFGKTLTQPTISTALDGYRSMLVKAVQPTEIQWPSTLPAGAGNKPWRVNAGQPFVSPPDDSAIDVDSGNELDFD